jgi:aryl-alcohol dehydrogenase-like predicted oxidoreductase
LGVIPYFPLAAGFLTGKYRSEKDLAGRARGEFVKKYMDDRGFRILDALDRVARRYHSAPATVALAWLISRPGITAPIASATRLDQLNELMKSMELKLDPSDIELLNRASAYGSN